jgi:ribonuclease E
MPNKMLIDASHPEETRVVVVRGNRIEEFDFESQDKKQLKGNIYLARVTRVEPSLQAAFVEYGGNRHGFLAFSEIHPDYYQIPVADRQALIKAETEAAEAEEEEAEEEERGRSRRRRRGGRNRGRSSDGEAAAKNAEDGGEDDATGQAEGEADEEEHTASTMAEDVASDAVSEPADHASDRGNGGSDESEVESVGAGDAFDEVQTRRRPVRRNYKIQEVIKRRQILLVQVVKEERGNKGAALTTYLSLAGRYSVLMPNTARGGGISRKITSAQDRKRLKEVVRELEVPEGMGVILRTAGESRTKTEIKRDYDYLLRMWENVRNLTLQSTAPALVYEEGSLIKRSVRDLYNKDIDEILVAGDDGYREAKDFMRMLMPSHAKVVQPYRDNVPIFARNGIEAQLDRMLQPQVTLKSGGYIIINQTEALVSIDVNSGRSTKEHSIEDTALQTNLEAAEEVARQLRLRDLAGLIVIDFIDMEENRNNRSVEKKLKDCLKNDRARIQVGRISHFGLLEMSRQRIRASVLESTMQVCEHCGGTGHVRSDSSVALHVMRAIEEFLLKDSRNHIVVKTPVATALYVLNNKRRNIVELEQRFALTITVEGDDGVGSQHYAISRGAIVERSAGAPVPTPIALPPIEEEDDPDLPIEDDHEEEEREPVAASNGDARRSEDGDGQRRKRRRRRRRGRDRDQSSEDHPARAEQSADASSADDGDEYEGDEAPDSQDAADAQEAGERKKRRRGKRGGRRNRQSDQPELAAEASDGMEVDAESPPAAVDIDPPADVQVDDAGALAPAPVEEAAAEEASAEKPRRRRAPRKSAKAEEVVAATTDEAAPAPADTTVETEAPAAEPEAKPARKSRRRVTAEAPEPVAAEAAATSKVEAEAEPEVAEAVEERAAEPKRGGWWQRKSFF